MDNIKDKIDDLFDEIINSNLYKDYLSIKKQLKDNKEITEVINSIRRLQKIATNNKDNYVEEEIKKLYEKLNGYPIYQSYLDIVNELKEELSLVTDVFNKYFEDILKL